MSGGGNKDGTDDPVFVDIDIEPVIGKKGDYIASVVAPPEFDRAQLDALSKFELDDS